MATLYRANGIKEEIRPAGSSFTLAELQTLVGGYIEIVHAKDGTMIVVDEEGKLKNKSINLLATELYQYGDHDPICGDAVTGTRLELDGPEDTDDDESVAPDIDSEPTTFAELTQLQYADPVKGESFRLYILDDDGMHSGGQWFRRVPVYADEEITVDQAELLAAKGILENKEIRVTDAGDRLVYHVKNGDRLYPTGADDNVWRSL
jgi:hypothetical protein